MAIDFPTSPATNDTYSYGGKTYSFNGTAWVGVAAPFGSGVAAFLASPTMANLKAALTDETFASFDAGAGLGLLTNPFFEISQENGTSAGAAASAYYPADQWYALESSDAVLSVQNVANPFSGTATLKRLQSSIKATATTADASLAAGQFVAPCAQPIEGTVWNYLGWGTSDARAIDIVFIAQCSVTGTYPVSVRNAAGNRSYVTTVSLTANVPTVCMVTIPGDTGGTWVTTTAHSVSLWIGAASGTDFQATSLNTWEAANRVSHSSCTNWAASGTTNFFQVAYCQAFPAGVLPFTSAAQITGEALQLLLDMRRTYDAEMRRCFRYVQKHTLLTQSPAASNQIIQVSLTDQMRVAPSTTLSNVSGASYSSYVVNSVSDNCLRMQITATVAAGYAQADVFLSARM